jgi:hypothetical protein
MSVAQHDAGALMPRALVLPNKNYNLAVKVLTKSKRLWRNNGNKLAKHQLENGELVDVKRIYFVCCDKSCPAKLIVKRTLETNEIVHNERRDSHTCAFVETAEANGDSQQLVPGSTT